MFIINFILNHAVDIMAILWILDQITAATPKTWKIGKFEIGKYDNIAVSFVKSLITNLVKKYGSSKETTNASENN